MLKRITRKVIGRGLLTMGALAIASPAFAAGYPISGKWTYDNPRADGPAKNCGQRFMSFEGDQRRDTGGSVPAYRNFSITPDGPSRYRVTDQFSTGQISARQTYTLQVIDADHVELQLVNGPTIALRRCE